MQVVLQVHSYTPMQVLSRVGDSLAGVAGPSLGDGHLPGSRQPFAQARHRLVRSPPGTLNVRQHVSQAMLYRLKASYRTTKLNPRRGVLRRHCQCLLHHTHRLSALNCYGLAECRFNQRPATTNAAQDVTGRRQYPVEHDLELLVASNSDQRSKADALCPLLDQKDSETTTASTDLTRPGNHQHVIGYMSVLDEKLGAVDGKSILFADGPCGNKLRLVISLRFR